MDRLGLWFPVLLVVMRARLVWHRPTYNSAPYVRDDARPAIEGIMPRFFRRASTVCAEYALWHPVYAMRIPWSANIGDTVAR